MIISRKNNLQLFSSFKVDGIPFRLIGDKLQAFVHIPTGGLQGLGQSWTSVGKLVKRLPKKKMRISRGKLIKPQIKTKPVIKKPVQVIGRKIPPGYTQVAPKQIQTALPPGYTQVAPKTAIPANTWETIPAQAQQKSWWQSIIPSSATIDKATDIAGRMMMMRMMMSAGQGSAYGIPIPQLDSSGNIIGPDMAIPGMTTPGTLFSTDGIVGQPGYADRNIPPAGMDYAIERPDTKKMLLIMGGIGLAAYLILK